MRRIAFEHDVGRWLESSSSFIAPHQRRSRAALERIVASAMRLFVENGFENTRVADIAQDAGVPVGTVYQRFADKAAILQTILDGYRSFRLGEIRALAASATGADHSARDVVELHVDIVFSAFRSDAGLLRLLEMRRLSDPGTHRQLVAANAEVSDLIAGLLIDKLPECDPHLLKQRVRYLHNVIRGSVVWAMLPQPDIGTETLRLDDPGYRLATLEMAFGYLGIGLGIDSLAGLAPQAGLSGR